MINSAFCLFGGILSSSTNTAFPVPSKLTAVFQVFCGAALATAAVAGPEGLGLKPCTTAALHEGVKVEDSHGIEFQGKVMVIATLIAHL